MEMHVRWVHQVHCNTPHRSMSMPHCTAQPSMIVLHAFQCCHTHTSTVTVRKINTPMQSGLLYKLQLPGSPPFHSCLMSCSSCPLLMHALLLPWHQITEPLLELPRT